MTRRPLPPDERRTRHVRVPVSALEGATLDAWVRREGRPLAELVRGVALAKARRSARG